MISTKYRITAGVSSSSWEDEIPETTSYKVKRRVKTSLRSCSGRSFRFTVAPDESRNSLFWTGIG